MHIWASTLFGGKERSVKLPKGMFKRGSSFYARLYSGGRERWISLGQELGEAKKRLHRLRGGEEPREKVTVAQACERWLASYVRTARNPKGQRLARCRAQKYLVPQLGARLLGQVSADDLRTYRLALERQELAPQTVSNVLTDVRCFFSWAEASGLLARSPVPRRLLPRLQERMPDRLTDDEVAALVEIEEPFGFVVRLGLGSGLRWGELCRLLASDVRQGVLMVSQTKSGKLRRVPLPPDLLSDVQGRVGRLVPFREGDPGTFSWHVRRLSGVERFHPHMMRHTYACTWIERGGGLPALQHILGHASIAMTLRYARLSDEAVREEVARTLGGKAVASAVAAKRQG
jgi:integrase